MHMQRSWYKSALGRFRVIAISEGISYLLLLFIAMPLKYFGDYPHAVLYTGWVHGLLFILYMLSGLDVKITHRWKFRKTALAVLASLVPFGPFILDKKILSHEKTASVTTN